MSLVCEVGNGKAGGVESVDDLGMKGRLLRVFINARDGGVVDYYWNGLSEEEKVKIHDALCTLDAFRVLCRKSEFDERESRSRRWLLNQIINSTLGYIYVVFVPREGYYKIGKSVDPEGRLNGLKRDFPNIDWENASLVHLIKTHDMQYAERKIHKQYKHRKVFGEFFKLSKDEIEDMLLITEVEPDWYAEAVRIYDFSL